MESRGITLAIVMDGRDGSKNTAREYIASDHDTYIEGREGSSFKIVIENRSGRRVAVIPSVDGLSVMDGTKASDSSGGYVLEAHGRVEIPGWSRGSDKVARFEFSGTKDGSDGSYVAQSGGDVEHKGVIGLTVLEQKPRPVVRPQGGSMFRGMAQASLNKSSVSLSASSAVPSNAAAQSGTIRASSAHEDTASASEPFEQNLGTAYGAEADFRTVRADFVRGEVLVRMSLFYEDERGLKRRGIDVRRPVRVKPNPFPGNEVGCPAPSGWNGR